jgi:hypothetical protein
MVTGQQGFPYPYTNSDTPAFASPYFMFRCTADTANEIATDIFLEMRNEAKCKWRKHGHDPKGADREAYTSVVSWFSYANEPASNHLRDWVYTQKKAVLAP